MEILIDRADCLAVSVLRGCRQPFAGAGADGMTIMASSGRVRPMVDGGRAYRVTSGEEACDDLHQRESTAMMTSAACFSLVSVL